MNKIVYVQAYFKPLFKEVTVKVPTGEKKPGLFFGERDVTKKVKQLEQTGWSDREVDGQRLAEDIHEVVTQLNREGYEVVTLQTSTSGAYAYKYEHHKGGLNVGGSGYGYGYGYSYTEGVTIVAKKITTYQA
jgi:hypothetical protein